MKEKNNTTRGLYLDDPLGDLNDTYTIESNYSPIPVMVNEIELRRVFKIEIRHECQFTYIAFYDWNGILSAEISTTKEVLIEKCDYIYPDECGYIINTSN